MATSILNVAGIYAIKNQNTGKSYVGSGKNIRIRWACHRRLLRLGIHHSPKLQASWNKHGEAAFSLLVLELVDDLASLLIREQCWLDQTLAATKGYNVCPAAASPLGVKHTDATRAKMREIAKGREFSAETRRLIGLASLGNRHAAGHKRSPQQIAALVAGKIGKPLKSEHRAKIARALLGNKNGVGFNPSPEHRAKLIAASTGRVVSDETREKLAASQRGRKHPDRSEQHRARLSEAAKGNKANAGRKFSPEHRARISAARQAYFAKKREEAIADDQPRDCP